MKYNGQDEALFEKDQMLVDVCSKYLVLKKQFAEEKMPPIEMNYQKHFKERYKIELTIDELTELMDFIDSGEFDAWQQARIDVDYQSGMQDIKEEY